MYACALVCVGVSLAAFTWRSGTRIRTQLVTVLQLLLTSLVLAVVGMHVLKSDNMIAKDGKIFYPWNFWHEIPVAEIIAVLLAVNFQFKLIPSISGAFAYYFSLFMFLMQAILFALVIHKSRFSNSPLKAVMTADVWFCVTIFAGCIYPGIYFGVPWSDYRNRFFHLFAHISNYALFKMTCMRKFEFSYLAAHALFPIIFAVLYFVDARKHLEDEDFDDKRDFIPTYARATPMYTNPYTDSVNYLPQALPGAPVTVVNMGR
jgi:hypothetical protein